MKRIFTAFTFGFLVCFVSHNSLGQNNILAEVCRQSDIIVEGRIIEAFCTMDEIGALNCLYTMEVDTIYKGNPQIEHESVFSLCYLNIDTVTALDEMLLTRDLLFFKRTHFFYPPDNISIRPRSRQDDVPPYNTCDYLILFLKEDEGARLPNVIRHFLIDDWFGAIPAYASLSEVIRKLIKED
jgi:hypothetical protein